MERVSVSIGIPVYNGEEYIQKAIDTLIAQTYRDFELIISDNASTDGTQALCERAASQDSRIRYIRQSTNIGAEANFTFLLKQAKGDYFMWGGHDDQWAPTFIERCVEALRADLDAVMAFPAFNFLYYGENRMKRMDPDYYFPFAKDIYVRLKQFIRFYIRDGKATPIYGLWRRKAIEHDGFYAVRAGDASFVLRGLSRGHFVFINEDLFYKGILPGKDYFVLNKITASRVINSIIQNRIPTAWCEITQIGFLLGVPDLSLWQKIKLTFWEIVSALRVFVGRTM